MNKYHIYRIDENGETQKRQTTHAETITSAWAGSRGWYSDGTYLITNGDGSEAQLFILKRG